ncbi:MAG: ABC transporter substrate-binding protein [Deltaproteobacteria bacterium]|nr:ABC transporter substrate-binding protein [Deltaproteobacteria bacterium]
MGKRLGIFCLVMLCWPTIPVSGQELQKIRISYSSRSNSTTVYQVALARGFFKEEGLDPEMIQMNPRLGGLAVMNGDIEFTTTFGSTLRGIVSGLPIKFAAISVRKTDHFLITKPEIKSVQELRGKRLGISTLFGTDQLAAEDMMRSKGFDPSSMQAVALGDAPVRVQALRSGLVEAIAMNAPHDMALMKSGYNVLAGPQDLRRSLPLAGLALKDSLLKEKPAMIKRTLRAVLKAHRFIFDNKQETTRVMMQWLSQPPEVAARSYDLALLFLSRNGEIPDADMELLTEKKRPLDEVRDYTLLREAQKELGMR